MFKMPWQKNMSRDTHKKINTVIRTKHLLFCEIFCRCWINREVKKLSNFNNFFTVSTLHASLCFLFCMHYGTTTKITQIYIFLNLYINLPKSQRPFCFANMCLLTHTWRFVGIFFCLFLPSATTDDSDFAEKTRFDFWPFLTKFSQKCSFWPVSS